jgi:hypothetical protein
MPTQNAVNLDALIPRQDMGEEVPEPPGMRLDKLDIRHFSDDSFFLPQLRKPDFQRETAHWTPDKVVDLVRAFVDGDLIPAVILWQRGSNVFVIDGAHRLSALMAWVKDDYGDKPHSRNYFEGRIPEQQAILAETTRKKMDAVVGAYRQYVENKNAPQSVGAEMQRRIGNLATTAILAQWVTAVEPRAAEASFFKINQAATPIDPTERRILKSRDAPNAVAARAIVRGGTGHKYWKNYPAEAQARIEQLAREISSALYEPAIKEPVKTLDLPLAGKGYNALPFVFDLLNSTNGLPLEPTRSKEAQLPPDTDGSTTITYMEKVRRTLRLLTGTHPSSLGIHPVVYFYTRGGEFQATVFLATAEFFRDLERRDQLKNFTEARRGFEDFLLARISHQN